MPYLTGGSLRDILAREGAFSLTKTVVYIDQAAAALDYAHAHHVIHRDLKPGNFLLHADGRLVLSDFGLYFRNQPGNAQGIYTFLIHQDGSWSSYVYNNTTGEPTQIASGRRIGDAHASMTVDVAVNGDNFTFYVNGNQVGSVIDTTYTQGTVGIALDSGGTIFASNFVLYTIQ